MELEMRQDGDDLSDDDNLVNTFSLERRTRKREFFDDNLRTIEYDHKRLKYDTSNNTEINCFNGDDFRESQTESAILKYANLNIFTEDEKVQIKLTSYSVYDEKKHLCSFDNDLIKEGEFLYAAGYAKPIHSECSDITDGIPIRNIGPITSWWITGFDGGEKAILGVSTDVADYYLMRPSPKYEPFLKEANHKMFMVKLIIEFLRNSAESDATYDNLMYKLQITVPPCGFKSLTETDLLTYVDSVYDLVSDYDLCVNNGIDGQSFANTPCMKKLASLAKTTCDKRSSKIRVPKKNNTYAKKSYDLTKAATTNLVENVFESLFPEQMDKGFIANLHLVKECYVLLTRCDYLYNDYSNDEDKENNEIHHTSRAPENVLVDEVENLNVDSTNALPELKELRVVLERIDVEAYKNGKSAGKSTNPFGRPFSILLEKWTDQMIEKYIKDNKSTNCSIPPKKKRGKYNFRNRKSLDVDVKFLGEPILVRSDRCYFREAMISNYQISVGDYVTVPEDYESHYIGRVMSMWEEKDDKSFHIHWLVDGTNTILGDIGSSQELFDTNDCDDIPLPMIEDKVDVRYLPIDCSLWMTSGNASYIQWETSSEAKNEKSFVYQKLYDSNFGRFEDVEEVNLNENRNLDNCPYCVRNHEKKLLEKPVVNQNPEFDQTIEKFSLEYVRWRDEEFRVGSCVFLQPGTLFKYDRSNKSPRNIKMKDIDEDRYPEMYRKVKERKFKKNGNEFVEPFEVGYVVSIQSSNKPSTANDISVTVKKFYRPENTHLDKHIANHLDLNLLYWSNEEAIVSFEKIEGKCYVANLNNLSCSADEWTAGGPYRFYYEEAYVAQNEEFTPPPTTVTQSSKVTDHKSEIIEEKPKSWPNVTRPLKSLDIFAGCGGLTEGLHQAGIANCCWAIEKEDPAAHAFRLNYPNAVVYTEDCNELLKLIMNGQSKKDGQTLPRKGEVELLCGGPPCQGFSRMNRFNEREYSCFKNSLIVSFMSYVDYFRPRHVVMENVRNFASFKKNMVLKLTLQCLIKMGYQCTFGVLQAGHFGVPQNRRRVILLAAAPGEVLPVYPEPINSFEENAIGVLIDGKKVPTNIRWQTAAPYRKLSIYDAISDLPVIESGGNPSRAEMSYDQGAKTHFQRLMRKSNHVLKDHVSKTVNVLVEKRISFIPKTPGADWRDLPNIKVQLSDGSYTKKLVYTHRDVQNGEAKNGNLRGVCCCASGQKCNSKWRQADTLIPWCLPHTGNRNNHWSGLYGRVSWDSNFKTVTTNLDPLGKQGEVIHPDQNRISSVRELARAQGFPDKFRFFGNTQDRYRQIGNAVPPPLAAAIGREIAKAVAEAELRR